MGPIPTLRRAPGVEIISSDSLSVMPYSAMTTLWLASLTSAGRTGGLKTALASPGSCDDSEPSLFCRSVAHGYPPGGNF